MSKNKKSLWAHIFGSKNSVAINQLNNLIEYKTQHIERLSNDNYQLRKELDQYRAALLALQNNKDKHYLQHGVLENDYLQIIIACIIEAVDQDFWTLSDEHCAQQLKELLQQSQDWSHRYVHIPKLDLVPSLMTLQKVAKAIKQHYYNAIKDNN